jgi:hypothetical protein
MARLAKNRTTIDPSLCIISTNTDLKYVTFIRYRITSKVRKVIVFAGLIVNIGPIKVFHTEFVGMFMIYLRIKLYFPS